MQEKTVNMDRYTIMGLINIQKQAIENVSDILICYPSEGVDFNSPSHY